MTSVSPHHQNPSQAPSTSSASQSYASATKKAVFSPPIATSSSSPSPAVAVGGTQPVQQNPKSSAISPVNGRAAITPAVPAVATPAVAHSTGALNGVSIDHGRKPSVTIGANGGYVPNGGSVGGQKAGGIQFGFMADTPPVSHSVPQIGHSASVPIPIAGGNPRAASPAQSPSPIPQAPASSGGRPPSGFSQQGNGVTFGSLGGDVERHTRQVSLQHGPPGVPHNHLRRESSSDIGNQVPTNRGGFSQQGGRGRSSYGSSYQQPMGYQPGPQFRGAPAQGRSGMPPPFQGQGRPIGPYPNSPHQATRSPALTNSMPGTPNMAQVMPMQTPQQYGGFPQHFMGPQSYRGYPHPQFDPTTGLPMVPFSVYPQVQYMQSMPGQPQSPQPGYQSPYNVGQYSNPPPQPQPMSRTSSQISERPNSSLGQAQTAAIPTTTSQAHTPQTKSAVAASPAVQRAARTSSAIPIKTPDGHVLQIPQPKAPASPAQSNRSGTPPVVTSTPPPKSSTPQHTHSDGANVKSNEQIRFEFMEQTKKAVEAETKSTDANPVEAKEIETKVNDDADTKAKEEQNAKAEEAKAKEDEAKAQEEAKAKEEAEARAAAEKAKQEEEDLERQIREMEEAEERREKARAEYQARRAAEKAAADKANAEKNKLLAEENDRKLREQEREMERLEDERERKRLEAQSKAQESDVQARGNTEVDTKKQSSEKMEMNVTSTELGESAKEALTAPHTLVSKLSGLTLSPKGGDSGTSTPASDDSMGPSQKISRGKPAALNLAPLVTKPVEPPQPSAALQSLKSARFLSVIDASLYPSGISSPNPALNSAVTTKGRSFKYDKEFLLQFQKVFTEKPSMEFESQIKVLIGDNDGSSARVGSSRTPGGMGPRTNSNRNLPAHFATMGSFNANAVGAGKTLPPGTTSTERFAMAQGTIPRPAPNPMAAFNRPGGAFPSGNPMTRTPSSSNMGSVGPHSPRQQNNSRRQGSKREAYKESSKQEAQNAKNMPLTASMDIKPIQISSTGWKPRSVMSQPVATGTAGPAPGASAAAHMDPDMVQRKVKAALNKMTPEKFDKIADQILAIAAQSKDEADGRTLRQAIQLTFEKATDEAHWASMYAKFCKRMLETMSPEIKDESILDKNGNVVSGGNLFRKYLLNRCQEEFERGWKVDPEDQPEGEDGETKPEEAAMLSDAYYKAAAAKRRGLGLVQFIGELYKLGMLTERIMHQCVKKLVDYTGVPDEAEIESLTKLLRTIGGNLDSTEKGKPMMDVYFTRIQATIDTPELPSRLRFMLMDVVDLRNDRWRSKEDNKGPKTLDEVRADVEAAAAQKAAESARSNQRSGGSSRLQLGRGDSRNFSGGQYGNQPPVDYQKNTVATDDLRRLGKNPSRQAGAQLAFGPTSMFSSRSNSGRKMGPGGSLSRTGEDSGASSRTGTPPQQKEKESTTSANSYSLLADLSNSGEHENAVSPPSVAASPAMPKASLAGTQSSADKKDNDL